MHRAPAAGMIERASDPRADKIRRRKSRRASLRTLTKEIGIVGAIRASLDARQVARLQVGAGLVQQVEENCPRCLAKRRRIA
jgi:hypothetical protein